MMRDRRRVNHGKLSASIEPDRNEDLDRWVKDALDADLARTDAAFDFEAGLTDVYDRAGLEKPKIIGDV